MVVVDCGSVNAGVFIEGALVINGVDIGHVDVAQDDSDSALVNAISAIEGVEAALDGSALTISHASRLEISGSATSGDYQVIDCNIGIYE